MRGRWASVLFAGIAAIFLAVVIGMTIGRSYEQGSFKAFYCAGKTVALGADPYRVQPLRSCQQTADGAYLDPGEVEPAPLPGYAIAPFVLLSKLSFGRAAMVFGVSAAAATILSALLLSSIAEIPAALVLLLLAPLALLNIAYSEIPIFAVAALCFAGWALKKKYWVLAAIGAAATLIQPQVATPVILSMLVFAPRSRIALLCSLAVLATVSLAVLGVQTNVEYLTAALPAQAASELAAADQYSLSHLLYTLHVPAAVSLRAAEAFMALMACIGTIAAQAARVRLRAPEMIAFLPPAAVLLGGVYAHDIQVVVALPAALVAAVRLRGAQRTAAWLALVLLAVVWSQRPHASVVFLNLLAVTAAAFVGARAPMLRGIVRGAASAPAVLILLVGMHAAPAGAAQPARTLAPAPTELAARAWGAYLRATPARTTESVPNLLTKIPTWLAIAMLLGAVLVPVPRRRAYGSTGSGLVSDVST